VGAWYNVTPSTMDLGEFGIGAVVANPSRPSDLYTGGGGRGGGIWKSTDYGSTWKQINGSVSGGYTIAAAATSPPTLWVSALTGNGGVYKSTNDGASFRLTGTGIEALKADVYSIKVDPYDAKHLITGLHETDGIAESTDGGETWRVVTGPTVSGVRGWPSGGISWYIFFINTGNAATTRRTWFAIAQNGGSAALTTSGGAAWTIPDGIAGLQHPHGCSQLYQTGSRLFIAGLYGKAGTQGVYSADLGAQWDVATTWSHVDDGSWPESIVWGTPKHIYATWGWAYAGASPQAPHFEVARAPGTASWAAAKVPSGMDRGASSVVVVNDGSRNVFVGGMWGIGLWRYIEP
jgi:hypothetical protein